jgi:hypothetical protein
MKNARLALAILAASVIAYAQTQARRDVKPQVPSESFKGITTNGNVVPDLFPIRATGVTTEPVRKAAQAFLDGLGEEQRQRTLFPVDDQEWRMWDNRHFMARQGMAFADMTEKQRELAFSLVRAGLSAKGFQTTRDIMRLNHTLGELANDLEQYSEWLYFITIMGKPDAKQPWGWQLDGHHAIVNYFVLGDQVVMTPTFMGSEPVRAEAGKYKGTVVLQDEQDRGLLLMRGLRPEQQQKARIVTGDHASNANLTEAYKDNVVMDYAGIAASELDAAQQKQLRELIALYVSNMDDRHARVKMSEVEKHLAATRFGWIGATENDSVFYYRIQSPVILIEFDHQSRVAPPQDRTRVPTRQHIHTVVRTPNGNDYGKDLLRLHHQQHAHVAERPAAQ